MINASGQLTAICNVLYRTPESQLSLLNTKALAEYLQVLSEHLQTHLSSVVHYGSATEERDKNVREEARLEAAFLAFYREPLHSNLSLSSRSSSSAASSAASSSGPSSSDLDISY